jgi:hypothetical protein
LLVGWLSKLSSTTNKEEETWVVYPNVNKY